MASSIRENGGEKHQLEEQIAKLKIGEEEKAEVEEDKSEVAVKELKTVTVKIGESKFEVDEEAAEKWKKTTKTEVVIEEKELSFLKITASAFSKIVEYRKMQLEKNKVEELNGWVFDFAEKLEHSELLGFVNGAYYLEEEDLMNTLCQVIADRIKGKSVAEIRDIFNVESGYTEEEEAALKEEMAWAFQ